MILLISIMFIGCINDDHDTSKGLSAGDALPNFNVDTCISDTADWRYDGGEDTILSNRSFAGKVGIIVFFNTDCEDCQKELPEIQEVYDNIKNKSDYQLICIAREEKDTDIKKYWKENNLTLPYSAQSDRRIYNLFANSVIPRIYIVKQGIIAYIHTDSPLANSSQLMEEIQ